ncbi:probable leucine-rich repeat receptor-like protein kinase At1g68400 [Dioscorea cayenensis subsp. rotundata]|uniref:Probable leucine-rich repeat receptor-like protein kinase At1g68400 n=1 Tax=Dioscorea cayennensis subsp. rotundata TaxID=55577 RepID=A0AB40B515_DIOCR|nr:probable leucine-rich repeat receptor-like protein kinase At1g68400 [Dioscorea cayenensis subsp. rotundata]
MSWHLSSLYCPDLSFNLLSGQIPLSLNHLPHLLTLRLNSNNLFGPILVITLPNLQDLNLSSNSLIGPIPPSLSSFPLASFAGNSEFISPSSGTRKYPARTRGDELNIGNPTLPTGSPTITTIFSSPRSKLDQGIHLLGMNHASLIAIITGDLAALLITFTILFLYFWPKIGSKPPSHHLQEGEKIVFSSSKDGYVTAYKAVLQDKNVVAVKCLQETGSGFGKREFEQQMAILGRI